MHEYVVNVTHNGWIELIFINRNNDSVNYLIMDYIEAIFGNENFDHKVFRWSGTREEGISKLQHQNFFDEGHLFNAEILNTIFNTCDLDKIGSLFDISERDVRKIFRENSNIPGYRNGLRQTSYIDAFESRLVLTTYIIAMREHSNSYAFVMRTITYGRSSFLRFRELPNEKSDEINRKIADLSNLNSLYLGHLIKALGFY